VCVCGRSGDGRFAHWQDFCSFSHSLEHFRVFYPSEITSGTKTLGDTMTRDRVVVDPVSVIRGYLKANF
jgi:hypothetical protein